MVVILTQILNAVMRPNVLRSFVVVCGQWFVGEAIIETFDRWQLCLLELGWSIYIGIWINAFGKCEWSVA